ncbi:MAG TPA: histidine phosphatase family protein [Firmicutes bacterium]|uniref:Histidine phosphatase family protein n=1 Tax=Capillibacterium thermochitinicola TaxID=2699427 RepID=A0A8J6HZJ0_9FIRM|nr:histidine phosphatase family protein [Capillibacterium thermochitinicola]MBA2132233.1 histidine phosphatase family protein [Capillibacterium thermochitinicola]HHW12899.1 histidine phosphatase family protein [Bacillota bacterium]
MFIYEPLKASVPTGSRPATRFCLVRHGTTDWNRENRIQGVTDTPLNEQGRAEIGRLAVAMKDEGWEVVVASDLQRAAESGEIIGRELMIPVFFHKGLRERSFGPLEGLTFEEVKAEFPEGSDHLALPGLESRRAIEERAAATMAMLATVFAGRRVIVVTHGGFIRAFFRAGWGLERKAPANAERVVVVWDGTWQLVEGGRSNDG